MKISSLILLLCCSFLIPIKGYGQLGKALVLDGYNNYFEVPDHTDLDYRGQISIEFWMQGNCVSAPGNEVILSKQWCVYETAYWLAVNDGKLTWGFTNEGHCNSPSIYTTDQQVINDEFTHIAIVHSSSKVQFYVNGNPVSGSYSQGGFKSIYDSSEPLRIGTYKSHNSSIGSFYSGLLDEIRVWKTALTQSQIEGRMNNPLQGNETGLILYLDMEDDGQSSGLRLKNKSSLGNILDAIPIQFSSTTPYLISPNEYQTVNFDLGNDITTCQFPVTIDAAYPVATSYNWSTGETSPSIEINNYGEFYVDINTENCKKYTDTIYVTQDTVSIQSKTSTICANDSMAFRGKYYSAPGSYFDTIQVDGSCDSIFELHLNVIDQSVTFLTMQTCRDSTLTYNGQPLVFGDTNSFVFQSTQGCDSIIQIFVEPLTIFGDTSIVACCSSDSVQFEDTYLKPFDEQHITYQTSAGCDSLVYIIVTPIEVSDSTIALYSCNKDSVFYGNIYLQPNTSHVFTFTSTKGCDSLVKVDVFETDIYSDSIEIAICAKDSFEYQNQFLFPGDSANFYFVSRSGCDSIVSIFVSLIPNTNGSKTIFTCDTNGIKFNGAPYYPGTDTTLILTSTSGCDSLLHFRVIHAESEVDTLRLEVCDNKQVWYNDTLLNPNTYTLFKHTNFAGCDSSVVVETPAFPTYQSYITLEACANETVKYLDATLRPNSYSEFKLSTINGCDSMISVAVKELPTHFKSEDITICENDSILYNDSYLHPNSQQLFEYQNTFGCDSVVQVNIDAYPIGKSSSTLFVCPKDSIEYLGKYLYGGNSSNYFYTNQNGCDSIHTVEVKENQSYPFLYPRIQWTCTTPFEIPTQGPNISWSRNEQKNTLTVNDAGYYYAFFTDSAGCIFQDSILVDVVEYAFYVPNAFSPNNDSKNDCFRPIFPPSHQLINYQLTIFNRWGQIVFRTTNPQECWDGSIKHLDYVSGIYAWVITLTNVSCSEEKTYKGIITIIN